MTKYAVYHLNARGPGLESLCPDQQLFEVNCVSELCRDVKSVPESVPVFRSFYLSKQR